MKKTTRLLSVIACIALFIACGKDDEVKIDYAWKQANEAAFNALKDSVEADPTHFAAVSIPGGPGVVYCKLLNAPGDIVGTEKAKYTSTVTVTYKGWLISGAVFDDATNRPMTFKIDGSGGVSVIDGWKIALQNMCEGEYRRIWIPWNIGYGQGGNGNVIPGYSTLIFDIKLQNIKKD
jgi:FKBP-type peptidyl-prolyl cis-trans isomerase